MNEMEPKLPVYIFTRSHRWILKLPIFSENWLKF